MARCYVLLLGGIGAGKSEAARAFAQQGATVIDADDIGHEVLEFPDVVSEIASRWPSAVIDGKVDRQTLGRIVFSDADELDKLEGITHPGIAATLVARVRACVNPFVVVEMPLLFNLVEGDWTRVVVDAPRALRFDRLLKRGLTESEIHSRVDAQPPAAAYLEVADHVIDNSGTPDALVEQVGRLSAALGCTQAAYRWRPFLDEPDQRILPQ
jgi:dephospho-CoA kinase